MQKITSPYRYDFVGSFLRPENLKQARKDYRAGKISKEQLTAVEDAAIRELVAKQKQAGYHIITDGEYRLKDGNCVRLFKGDFSTVEKVAADYMETAKGFEAAGASWIHMVDLDGAKEGRPVNQHIYEDVAAKTGLKVEVGGGIRNLETIDTYLKSGVERVILGSAALKNPQLVKDADRKSVV